MKFLLLVLALLSLLTTTFAETNTAYDKLAACQESAAYRKISDAMTSCDISDSEEDDPDKEELTCFCTMYGMESDWEDYNTCVESINDESVKPVGSFTSYCRTVAAGDSGTGTKTTAGKGTAAAATAASSNGAGVHRGGYTLVVGVLLAAWVGL